MNKLHDCTTMGYHELVNGNIQHSHIVPSHSQWKYINNSPAVIEFNDKEIVEVYFDFIWNVRTRLDDKLKGTQFDFSCGLDGSWKNEPKTCIHTWKDYLGLKEQFTYCTKCDEKKK